MSPPKKGTEFQCPPRRTEGLHISIKTLGMSLAIIATVVAAIFTHEDRYAKTSEIINMNKAILENQKAIQVLTTEMKEVKSIQSQQAQQIIDNQDAITKQLAILIKIAEKR